jgi:hypothetical protein
LGESYTGIGTLADFSAIVIYTNWPSGVVEFLVATLESANKRSGAVVVDINLVAMLVSVNSYSIWTLLAQLVCDLQVGSGTSLLSWMTTLGMRGCPFLKRKGRCLVLFEILS